jgi:transcriptional regulator with XRE-family HTH domain
VLPDAWTDLARRNTLTGVPPPTTPGTARNGLETGPPITAGVGQRIAAARRRAELTLAAVAERSGMSVAYVSEIETGSANPTLRALDRIAAAVGTRVLDLLGAGEDSAVPFPAHRCPAALAHAVDGMPGVWDRTAPGSSRLTARIVHGGAADHGMPVSHPGEEYALVLNGWCLLEVDRAEHRLDVGDSCHYAALLPHRIAAASSDLTLSVVMSAR